MSGWLEVEFGKKLLGHLTGPENTSKKFSVSTRIYIIDQSYFAWTDTTRSIMTGFINLWTHWLDNHFFQFTHIVKRPTVFPNSITLALLIKVNLDNGYYQLGRCRPINFDTHDL